MNNKNLVGQQGEYKNLVDFFEEYRPVMTDIVYIYYGIMTNENYKITIGERELNLEHVYYNCESGDVDVRVRYNYDIKRLLDYVCMALKYADEETRSFAIEFRTKYYKGQISECKLLLKDYIERLRYSHRVVTLQNVFFVAVIAIISFLLVIMHY
ncbi:MAG: hypothetical protein E7265_06305 [Lachnospiraceae bacterium]|nr:hypothetical protein [Lachnospiraceae bacterium]